MVMCNVCPRLFFSFFFLISLTPVNTTVLRMYVRLSSRPHEPILGKSPTWVDVETPEAALVLYAPSSAAGGGHLDI